MKRRDTNFELGIYSLADLMRDPITANKMTAKQRLDEIVEAAKLADEAGLDLFGVGEHHRLDYAISTPAVVLSYVAAVTKRMKLMSTTSVLNTTDPVRLFQEFATLDLLSGGRAELIVGRGAFVEAFSLFGYELEQYDQLFEDNLSLLMKLNEEEVVSWQGKYRTPLHEAEISPQPLKEKLPIWVGVGSSVESAARAGRMGAKLALSILGGNPEDFKPFVEAYREEATKAGIPEHEQQVTVTGHMFMADSDELAKRQFYPYYSNYWSHVNNERGIAKQVTQGQFRFMSDPDSALFVGSPELIIEKILQQHECFGHTRFLAQMDIGALPFKYVARNIEYFATRVAPVIRKELNK